MNRIRNDVYQFHADQRSSAHSMLSSLPFTPSTFLLHILYPPTGFRPTPLPFSPFSSTTHQILINQGTLLKSTPIQSPPHPQSTLLTKTTLHPHHTNNPIISNTTTKQKDSTITTHQLQPNTPLPSHYFTPLHQHTSLTHQLIIAYATTAFSRNR